MQRQINRLFDQMLSPQESDRLRKDVAHRGDIIAFTPPAEIHETTDAFKLGFARFFKPFAPTTS
ncbi:hypothetical protein [Nostoc sp. CHAB 5715]|uniref:hypothetical protein n=1 Tax=Nostoc sp. CHAB 5715 TaxID=2780400 RepID=UPI001E54D9DD|nr:hypothetical protein [Nostoc sp. CHAB 5715]MCC5623199.1 hypothetical protein [Nostoc sp. CHAB 5715]